MRLDEHWMSYDAPAVVHYLVEQVASRVQTSHGYRNNKRVMRTRDVLEGLGTNQVKVLIGRVANDEIDCSSSQCSQCARPARTDPPPSMTLGQVFSKRVDLNCSVGF